MDWTEWFVIHWTQCAASVFVVLMLSRLMMHRWNSPDEKIKSICTIMAAITVLPICSLVSLMPGLRVELGVRAKIHEQDSGQARVANVFPSQSKSGIQNDTPARLTAKVSPRVPDNSTLAQEPTTADTSPLLPENNRDLHASIDATAQTPPYVSPLAIAFVLIAFLQGCGVVGFTLTWLLGRRRLQQILRNSSAATLELQERWNEVSNGKGTHVRVLESGGVSSPMTIGFRAPIVIVPKQLTQSSKTDVVFCLAHEWAHINRRDALVWAWFRAVQMLYWFQPGIRSLGRELRLCQELIADRTVVRTFDKPDIYCELLIRLSVNRTRQLAGAMAMAGCPSQLSARVTALLDPDVRQSKRIGSCFQGGVRVIVVFLLLGINALRFTSADAAEPVLLQKNPTQPRAVRYTRTVSTKYKSSADRIYQETVVDDGRCRSELQAKDPGFRELTLLDEEEGEGITLWYSLEMALKRPVLHCSHHTYQQLLRLSEVRHLAAEKLSSKLLNGRMVDGFQLRQFDRTYRVWSDVSTGEMVQVEFDAPGNEHVTMTDFHMDEPVQDSMFTEEIPTGFKVKDDARHNSSLGFWPIRVLQSISRIAGRPRDMGIPVNASKVWERKTGYSRIVQLDDDRFLHFRSGWMSVMNAKGTRLSTWPVQADRVSSFDMDGDGKKELLGVADSRLNLTGYKTEFVPPSLTLYSDAGILMWAREIDVQRLKYGSIPQLSIAKVADFAGDANGEICIGYSSSNDRFLFSKEGNKLQSPLLEQGVKDVIHLQVDGETKDQYLVVDAKGELIICNRMGETLRRFSENAKARTWMVRAHEGSGRKQILAIGQKRGSSSSYQYVLTAYAPSGEQLWETDLKRAPRDALLCPNRPWIAVSELDGVEIIDIDEGKPIASLPCNGSRGMAWVIGPDSKPLLVVAEKDDELVVTQRTAAYRFNE